MGFTGKNKAFSLIEAVIAIFLLSFAALSVLSLTQSGFVAQKRNQEISRANLVIQSVVADMRLWAANINNYQSDWAPYNRTFSPPDYPGYKVKAQADPKGRALDSPCAELESQWELTPSNKRGKRTMPKAIIPVELTLFWSADPKDQVSILTYVGEPRRDVTGIKFNVDGPSRASLTMTQLTHYKVSAQDAQKRPLPNLMFQWIPDDRYVSITDYATRDGRYFEVVRDQTATLPDVPPPLPPALSPVTCYARYAGEYLAGNVTGIALP